MFRRHSASSPQRLMRWIGIACLLVSAALGLRAAKSADDPPARETLAGQTFKKAAVIRFDGEINRWLQGYVERKLAAAEAAGCDLVVLQIDSPGGLLSASSEMAEYLREMKWAKSVAYIPRDAISGAAFVSLGCDEIVMHPSGRLGDVGVIFLDPFSGFKYVPEKIMSPVVTEIRTLAESKGRSPALAEAMVDREVEVFQMRHKTTGRTEFMTRKEMESRADKEDWDELELVIESQKGRFLTVSGRRALDLRLADANVDSFDELKSRYNVTGEWKVYAPDAVDNTVYVLNLWWVTGILFVVGLVGLLHEALAPGACIGALIAVLCFALFFWSRFLTGTSGWLEVTLFALGLLFLGVEVFVLPGFGVAGIGGLLLITASLVLACQNFVIPQTQSDWWTTTSSLLVVGGAGTAFLVIGAVMLQFFGNLPLLNRLVLQPEVPAATVAKPEVAVPVKVGERGTAESPLRPSGRARFGERYLDVVAESGFISRGTPIEVVGLDGGTIYVRPDESAGV